MTKAEKLLKNKVKEWTISVPMYDPYYIEGYNGAVIGNYVFITTHRPSISLTDVFDSAGKLVFQYCDDEYNMLSAYKHLTGSTADIEPTLTVVFPE